MRPLLYCLPLLALALAGCGDKPAVTTHPVEGCVVVGGKPAAGVQVFLYPTSAPMMPQIPANPHGVTGPDGRFAIGTFGKDDGAAEGGYQVILLWPPESAGREESDGDRLLGWYTAVHSKLTANVKPGRNALADFNLPVPARPPEAVQGIPGKN